MLIHRKRRVRDFQSRADNAPEEVCHHRAGGGPYIPVHHFAEETDKPVIKVDCWCLLGADAALLECIVSEDTTREPALSARLDALRPYWPKLYADLPAPLTRAAVEAAMQRFVEQGFPDPLLSSMRPGGDRINLSP